MKKRRDDGGGSLLSPPPPPLRILSLDQFTRSILGRIAASATNHRVNTLLKTLTSDLTIMCGPINGIRGIDQARRKTTWQIFIDAYLLTHANQPDHAPPPAAPDTDLPPTAPLPPVGPLGPRMSPRIQNRTHHTNLLPVVVVPPPRRHGNAGRTAGNRYPNSGRGRPRRRSPTPTPAPDDEAASAGPVRRSRRLQPNPPLVTTLPFLPRRSTRLASSGRCMFLGFFDPFCSPHCSVPCVLLLDFLYLLFLEMPLAARY